MLNSPLPDLPLPSSYRYSAYKWIYLSPDIKCIFLIRDEYVKLSTASTVTIKMRGYNAVDSTQNYQNTPQSSPVRASYGESFVCWHDDLHLASVAEVMY